MTAEKSTITGDPTNGTTTYTYDPLARLTGYTRTGTTTAYGWRATPNRSSVTVGAAPATTYPFDDANRVTADSAGGAYTADADGRLTSRPGQRLVWDALGRLTKVLPPTGNNALATYAYDPLDRLLLAHDGTTRTRFRYVGLTTRHRPDCQRPDRRNVEMKVGGDGYPDFAMYYLGAAGKLLSSLGVLNAEAPQGSCGGRHRPWRRAVPCSLVRRLDDDNTGRAFPSRERIMTAGP